MLWLRNMTCIACHYPEYQQKKKWNGLHIRREKRGERIEEREKTLET